MRPTDRPQYGSAAFDPRFTHTAGFSDTSRVPDCHTQDELYLSKGSGIWPNLAKRQ
jgi:hypothetical protein